MLAMNQKNITFLKKNTVFVIILIIGYSSNVSAFTFFQENYVELGGVVLNNDNQPIISATITINESNISTVTNDEGGFLLKVPKNLSDKKITISHIGYNDQSISLSQFNGSKITIRLDSSITQLSEVSIDPKDPEALIRAVMKKKGENYIDDNTIMTAFYRETIKKRRNYVSLSEAVVDVYKNPYQSAKADIIKLYKARKSANYKKLDTLAVKLQGGPTSTLYIDIMKNPEILFTNDLLSTYEFSFDNSTKINNRHIYVLNFKQRQNISDPLYYGKLYIDSETLAMTKAVFSLNTENKEEVSRMFVRKKPKNATVYPTIASYNINYREKDGKWYYGYGQIDLHIKINWRKKLFNSIYKLNVEMAITDWRKNSTDESISQKERLKKSVVIADEASGFSDPEFWGQYNVIEPEKPIESAIKKIKKQLKKLN